MHKFDRVGFLQAFIVAVDLYREDKSNWNESLLHECARSVASQAGIVDYESGLSDDETRLLSALQYVGDMQDSDKEYTLMRPTDTLMLFVHVEEAYKHYCALLAA